MKMTFDRVILGVLGCAAVLLSGCSSAFNPIGSNSYDCNRKQDPTSIYCHSFKAVEASTNGELPDSRFDTELKFSQYDKATDIAPVGKGKPPVGASRIAGGAGEAVKVGQGSLPGLGGPVDTPADDAPVIIGPVTQRTWIKHFVDGNDSRISNMIVYRQIEPSHWAGFDGGDPQSAERGQYPHKAADSGSAPVSAQNQPRGRQQLLSAQNEFAQPGISQPPPATEAPSSSNSMPQ